MSMSDAEAKMNVAARNQAVVISAGSLTQTTGQVNIGTTSGAAGTVTLAGGSLTVSGGTLSTVAVSISAGTFALSSGSATASGAVSITGGTNTISGGTLQGDTVSIGASATVTMSGSGILKGTTSITNSGTISGAGTIQGPLATSNVFTANGGTLDFDAAIANSISTKFGISNNTASVMVLSDDVGTGNTFTFAGGAGTLTLNDALNFSGTVAGLLDTGGKESRADTGVIRLTGVTNISSSSVTANNIQLVPNLGTINIATAENFSGSFVGDEVIGGDMLIWIDDVVCYAAGTRIATPSGEMAIEDIKAGDMVVIVDGDTHATLPVK